MTAHEIKARISCVCKLRNSLVPRFLAKSVIAGYSKSRFSPVDERLVCTATEPMSIAQANNVWTSSSPWTKICNASVHEKVYICSPKRKRREYQVFKGWREQNTQSTESCVAWMLRITATRKLYKFSALAWLNFNAHLVTMNQDASCYNMCGSSLLFSKIASSISHAFVFCISKNTGKETIFVFYQNIILTPLSLFLDALIHVLTSLETATRSYRSPFFPSSYNRKLLLKTEHRCLCGRLYLSKSSGVWHDVWRSVFAKWLEIWLHTFRCRVGLKEGDVVS